MLTLISTLLTFTVSSVEDRNAAAVWQSLKRLSTTATVLHTTAHPDDEDGPLLTWLSRGQGIRTGLFSLTRGEGGANLIGSELFDALGILRTEEQLAAARYYDVDLFFGQTVDFGYSKRLDESLEKWERQLLLEDTVRLIRAYRPNVIIARFTGDSGDGHGQHQASGLITRQAFSLAADPNQFPEQISAGLQPWQAQKLYISRSRWRNNGTEPSNLLRIDTGKYDPLLGRSYYEIARQGLRYQRSQGAGQRQASKGSWFSSLQLIETVLPHNKPEKHPLDDIDTTIIGMSCFTEGNSNLNAMLIELQRAVDEALSVASFQEPWVTMPYLVKGLQLTRELIKRLEKADLEEFNNKQLYFLLKNKEQEFMDAANKALGLAIEVVVDPPPIEEGTPGFFRSPETFKVAIPGQVFTLTTKVVNPSPLQIKLIQANLQVPKNWTVRPLQSNLATLSHNGVAQARFEIQIPEEASYSQPYWSRQSEYHDDVYRLDQPEFAHLPFQPPQAVGILTYQVEGVEFEITQPAQTVQMIQPWGENRRLLTVAPALSLTISPSIGVVPIETGKRTFSSRVEILNNGTGITEGKVHLQIPEGWTITPSQHLFRFTYEGQIQNFSFQILPAQNLEVNADYRVQAVAEHQGKHYSEGYQVIDHHDLEPRHLYRTASMQLHTIDVKVEANLKVGYVMGVGDKVPQALEQIGVKVQMLGSQELAVGDLSAYQTIIVGIRAYAVRTDLQAYNGRLLDYVYQGGNLVVQYQTPEFDAAPYGPYPYKLGRRPEEVSEEEAKVSILRPKDPIFNRPNQITDTDFEGWVEERGSKFMSEWDSNYQPLLQCHDKDQAPQRGGLLVASYGTGVYTYAAYAFYRQLPAGISGAYRLFANLISWGNN